jgi:hypothetical protein
MIQSKHGRLKAYIIENKTYEHVSPVKEITEYSCIAESGYVEKEQTLKSQQA